MLSDSGIAQGDFGDFLDSLELMDNVAELRAQLANVRCLCDSQRVMISKLKKLNEIQHELLTSKGLSIEQSELSYNGDGLYH